MMRKPQSLPSLLACSLITLLPLSQAGAQATVAPGTLVRLYSEAETAFGEKKYDTAVEKLQELLKGLKETGKEKDAPMELLKFNLGLGFLLGDKPAEAENAFTECLKEFPRGEYASRCYLGVGRACIQQGTPEKKQRAIDALKIAAQDPKFRTEAGLSLGQVYIDTGKYEEALTVFRTLMGSDIRSPQQTTAAVEVIGLLADTGKLEDLVYYLDRLGSQAGVRDAIAWYSNQVVVKGDELVEKGDKPSYQGALSIYRSVPLRSEIIAVQKAALEVQKRDVDILQRRVDAEKAKGLNQRSNAAELLNGLKPAVELAEQALKVIEEKTDLDGSLLMRRGRCLYYLDRYEEALVCFRTIRTKFASSTDAKSAAYGEITALNKIKDYSQIKELCDEYLRKYPDAENAEQVATLAGEVLVQAGKWPEVGGFYRNLEAKFPKSESIDRYVFFQGVAAFMEGDFKTSTPLLVKFIKGYPNSSMVETGMYYVAMSYFLSNDYKNTLATIKEYLSKFPDGNYAGDLRYRLAFIDFNDDSVKPDKIINDLTSFLSTHPDDAAAGSMLCLLGDTYKKKESPKQDELAKFKKQAIDAYVKAVWTKNPDDVKQYALDSATALMQANKDWAGIADLHGRFLKENPESPLALLSASMLAKMKLREGKGDEAAEMLAAAIAPKIGDPANEQVEFLLDELIKTQMPRGKTKDLDIDAIDAKVVAILEKAIGKNQNATTSARTYYARARLMQLLRRPDRSDGMLKGIATLNADKPEVLSPALLAVSGEILLKLGQLDKAEAMFQRLKDRFKDGNYSDAGPVGLGFIALARKKPDEAYKIFEDTLANNNGMARFKEATLGKLESLVALGKFDEAEKLGLLMTSDRTFRGETAGKAWILIGQIYRKKAEKAAGVDERLELYKMAHNYFQRVYISYKSSPEVCAEGYWQAYEVLVAMGDRTLAGKTLEALRSEEKLKNTERYKQAQSQTAP